MTLERHRVPIAGGALALVLHLPERPASGCVVACHGLGASKDSQASVRFGEELTGTGLALARVDFKTAHTAYRHNEPTTVAASGSRQYS